MASRTHSLSRLLAEEPLRRPSSTSSLISDASAEADHQPHRRRGGKTGRVPRRHSPQHAPTPELNDPSSASPSTGPRIVSRRESSSSMRNMSAPLEVPVTYTPTTHRVSKAKKGKRVHACEYPGCNKIFTRAEHRRRHELNHNEEASYPCNREGCRKAFHRLDLLQRHQERHDIEDPQNAAAHQRTISQTSASTEAPSAIMGTSMTNPRTPITPAQPSHSTGFSIPSIVNPPPSGSSRYAGMGMPNDFAPRPSVNFMSTFTSSSDEPWDYSDESSQSSVSDFPSLSSNTVSMGNFSGPAFYPITSSPLANDAVSGWGPPPLPPSVFPPGTSSADSNIFMTTYSGPPVPLPLSDVDGREWLIIRGELSSFGSNTSTPDDGVLFDTIRWQNCLDCYWQHFHPLFPIVHRPTFFATKPSPLMASAMVAIGSQYDTRSNAKEYSYTLLEIATKLLAERDTINSKSRLTDLQTVFLLEVLTKYRSRRANVQVSPRFRTLYASLTQARQHWVTPNPMAVFKRLRPDASTDELIAAQKYWTDRETRRRILQASFIFDTQHAALFEQQPALVPIPRPQLRVRSVKTDLPFPCDDVIWESSPVERWAANASKFNDIDLPTACQDVTSDQSKTYDAFQSRLVLSYLSTHSPNLQAAQEFAAAWGTRPDPEVHHLACFSYHALCITRNTPVRQLLLVSGETWLFGKKVDRQAEYSDSQEGLRNWIGSERSWTALWHATRLLSVNFAVSGEEKQERRLNMLQEEWSMYLAALVCWAIGLGLSKTPTCAGPSTSPTPTASEAPSHSSTSSGLSVATAHPPLLDMGEAEEEMTEYLRATNVSSVEALSKLDTEVLARTDGLLECVRIRRLGGPMGELLNEAERVLFRLVEARSRISF